MQVRTHTGVEHDSPEPPHSTDCPALSFNTAVKSLTLLSVVALFSASCMFHKPPAIPGALPNDAAKLLDAKYPGWQLADFTPASSGPGCADRSGKASTIVNDDFNTDGFGDWAVEIRVGDTIKLVAIMGWLADFKLHEIESAPGAKADRFLTSLPRGTKFTNPMTKSDDYLSHNSIVTQSCAGDRVFYLWDGDGFQKVIPGPAK